MLTLGVDGLYCHVSGPYEEKRVLKRVLTFDDPNAARNRQYKAGIWDGKIRLYNEEEDYFLSGLRYKVSELLEEAGVQFSVIDKNPAPPLPSDVTPDIFPGITLRDYQVSAAQKGLRQGGGICKIPTRGGKTFIAGAFLKKIDRPSLFLVDSVRLLRQTALALSRDLGFPSVGRIGDSEFSPAFHTVAIVDSIWERIKRADADLYSYLDAVKVMILDECQHASARTWEIVARSVPALYRFGLSGTPFKGRAKGAETVEDYLLLGLCGPPCSVIPTWLLIEQGWIAQPLIYMLPVSDPVVPKKHRTWGAVYEAGIVRHATRNRMALRAAQGFCRQGLKTLVLVQQREHGRIFLRHLQQNGIKGVLLMGGDVVYRQEEGGDGIYETRDLIVDGESQVQQEFRQGKYPVLVATTVLDEGVDIPEIQALIILSGGKSFIKTIQRLGRALNPVGGDNQVFIVDFMDRQHSWLSHHSTARQKEYREERHVVLGAAEFWARFGHRIVVTP